MFRVCDVMFKAALTVACTLTATCAFAETTVCDGAGSAGSGAGKITSVPFTITAPGVYCLTTKISSNLSSGAAITINANNVVLDLNNFAIGNLAAGASTTAVGVYAVDRQNILLRNGILRGFWAAVALLNGTQIGLTTALSSGHTVDGIVSDSSYLAGIVAQGPYVTVQNSKIMNTTGSNVTNTTVQNAQNVAVGIYVGGGVGIHVTNNSILNTDCTNGCSTSSSNVQGIDVEPSFGVVIENNLFINAALPTGAGTNGSQAIHFDSGNGTGATTNAFVIRNLMSNWTQGITFCNNGSFVCTGDMVENGAQGVASAYSNGGTAISGASNY